jgi:preprotein translocase subunit SecD
MSTSTLHFPRWKITAIILTCIVFCIFALPNAIPESLRNKLPSWLPNKTVSLGLDLQGGSHLLLQVDLDTYMRERLTNTLDLIRTELRKQKVGYQGLRVQGNAIVFQLVETDKSLIPNIPETIHKVDPSLEVKTTEANEFKVSFSEQNMLDTKLLLIDQSINIVNRRVNESGTREPIIQRQGDDRILLQVPGLQDPEQLKRLLGKTAKMTFHMVNTEAWTADMNAASLPPGTRLLSGEEKGSKGMEARKYPIYSRVMLSGDMLTDASTSFDQGMPAVAFQFNSAGAERFADITRENVGKPFAIVLDDKVITAPVIKSPILGGSGIITGSFSVEEANELSMLLRSGALPAPLKVIEERSVGPSLGADSIEAGKRASYLAIALVMGFMMLCYGLFGVFANIALAINMIMILACMSLFQATLTLPGIAGIVLTLGMAVDANVLIYERIREEIRNGKSPYAAIDHGFKAAFSTIMDSNLTTLIAAFLLFYFGTGSVKGFAVTLSIGIITSMFSAILVTRLMIVQWLKRTKPKSVPI